MYTTPTEDGYFVLGQHPFDSNVFVACAGNGEGFKFGMVLGEAVADLSQGNPERVVGMRQLFTLSRTTLKTAKSESL